MTRVASPRRSRAGQSLLLENVDWRMYSQLLRAFDDRPGVRLTYDRGRLEIRAPGLDLDDAGRFCGRLVATLTEELGLPLKAGGSTTMRRQLRQRGIEADESFWIANAARMKGRRRLDLRTDPPPDLAIEVAVTHSALDRLSIYAALGVPEVWWLKGDVLTFYVRGADGTYTIADHSLAFALVKPADLLRFLQQALDAGDENPAIREFRKWIRKKQGAGQ